MSEFAISTDLFLLPNDEGKTVLYAPLAGFVCHGNEDLVALLRDLETLRSEELSAEQKEIVAYLIRRGIVNGTVKRPIRARSGDLAPSKLTLFHLLLCLENTNASTDHGLGDGIERRGVLSRLSEPNRR